MNLYMFRTLPASIIRSFFRCTHTISNVIQVSWQLSSRIRKELLASCQQTFMTYTVAVCTVKNSWWWTEELSETCRILFQKQIWEFSTSRWFYSKNLSRCTVTWTLNYSWSSFLSLVRYPASVIGIFHWHKILPIALWPWGWFCL